LRRSGATGWCRLGGHLAKHLVGRAFAASGISGAALLVSLGFVDMRFVGDAHWKNPLKKRCASISEHSLPADQRLKNLRLIEWGPSEGRFGALKAFE
jgi:hypothetical protein